MSDPTWREAVKMAKHYLAIGQKEIYLGHRTTDYPWEFVTDAEPGGSHRLEISTSVRFIAKHPCGLSFSWSFDIEPYTANGKGSYEIDSAACRRVLSKLSCNAAKQFRDYLADCAAKVKAKADEWQAITARQYRDAAILRELASPPESPAS